MEQEDDSIKQEDDSKKLEDVEFFTQSRLSQGAGRATESPRGKLLLASCRSGATLASSVARRYQEYLARMDEGGEVPHLAGIDYQFSDSETCVRLEDDVSGHDVFLFQAVLDPASGRAVDQNYMAFFIAVKTLRQWGANHVTGVLPYLPYARQDKPTRRKREPTTAKLMADLSLASGMDRLITWDPHGSIHGYYDNIPVESLQPVPFFVECFHRFQDRDDVIAVAPDAGASRRTMDFSRALGINSAMTAKHRPRQEEVDITEIIGNFRRKRIAVILDVMISSGGTVHAVAKRLVQEKGIETVYVGVSHYLGQSQAEERLVDLHENYGLARLIVTNTIPQSKEFCDRPFVSVHDLSDIFSRAINRIHHNRPVGTLFQAE